MAQLKMDLEELSIESFETTGTTGTTESPDPRLNSWLDSHYDCSSACFIATNRYSGC